MRRRSAAVRAWPNTSICPESGAVMFMIMRRVEVLPAPFGPSRPKMLPAGTASETPSTATKSP